MSKPPGEAELQKDRFAPKLQGVWNSRMEIYSENEAQREEDQLSEMATGAHLESEIVPNEDRLPGKADPIIRPQRRAESGSLGEQMDLTGIYPL